MSIMVHGTLSVQRIPSVNGEFSVGKLDCELGMLNIKDPHLDQFETGAYTGRFGIVKVYSHGYAARTGCFIVETRAVLDEYLIHSDEPGNLDDDIALRETDPLDSDRATTAEREPAPSQHSHPAPQTVAPDTPEPMTEPGDPIAELFGELWPLGYVVKLDPTSIRTDGEGHRKRCQYLKSQGYAFKASTQAWHFQD